MVWGRASYELAEHRERLHEWGLWDLAVGLVNLGTLLKLGKRGRCLRCMRRIGNSYMSNPPPISPAQICCHPRGHLFLEDIEARTRQARP